MTTENENSPNDAARQRRSSRPPGSALLLRAVRAYHRAESDCFAGLFAAVSNGEDRDQPGASKWAGKRDAGKVATRLWRWGCNRWGTDIFTREEYRLRYEPNE